MKTSIKKIFYVLPVFIFLLACNEKNSSSYKPIAFGIKVNFNKNEFRETFEQYVNAYVFDVVICPLPNDSRIAPILRNGFVANYKKATMGDAKAQYDVGAGYRYGLGIIRNDDLGMEWIRKAAAQGYAPALSYYGLFFYTNKKNISNLSPEEIRNKSIEYLEKSTDQNFLPAKVFLTIFKLTSHTEKNHEKWINTLKDLAKQKNDRMVQSIAKSTLAAYYLGGYYVPENYEMALSLFKESLQQRPMLKTMDFTMATISLIYSSPTKLYDEEKSKLWAERVRQFDKEAIHCQKLMPEK